ncbi:glycosyltransferase [Aquimixticola soesokkakensis]|uniref:glycosyltransferase n=1 Tax=Aquimixticola soesokkakensis TaxID=1519096 RepID=UPI000A26E5A7|nr:glycosyltransferase [Aquimixticola soesokkakensis]
MRSRLRFGATRTLRGYLETTPQSLLNRTPNAPFCLRGWVCDTQSATTLIVGVFVDDALLEAAPANQSRADVAARGIGDGRCGFSFEIPAAIADAYARGEVQLHLRTLAKVPFPLGSLAAPRQQRPRRRDSALARSLSASRILLRAAADQPLAPLGAAPDLPRHAPLVAPSDPAAPDSLNAFAAYLQDKDRLPSPPERIEGLAQYLLQARACLPGVAPLASGEIAALNAESTERGESAAQAALAPKFGTQSGDCFEWVERLAPALRVADCLVTDAQTQAQSAIVRPCAEWPLTRYMQECHAATPALSRLDLTQVSGRETLSLALMLRAAVRPDSLRFLPGALVRRCLTPHDTTLDRFLDRLDPAQPPHSATALRLRQLLRAGGVDCDTLAPLTFSARGDRLAAATCRDLAPCGDDIQLVGPLSRASGLGEAARLSERILHSARLAVRSVDSSPNDPTPTIDAPRSFATAARAPVNLLHINAELLPLLYAAPADIFSGAHTIAYVFWELDAPARCQTLGMALVDELWVASDFGRTALENHTRTPVRVAGMGFDMPEKIAFDDGRATLVAQTSVQASDFVFLVTFDSFSFIDRKNPLAAIRAFRLAFRDTSGTERLVLKTHNRQQAFDPAQAALWAQIDAEIAQDPRITLVDATLDRDTIRKMIAGSDAYVSLHRAEGWGFGMLEAMALGCPVICTAYSGNLAFSTPQTAYLVDYRLTAVPKAAYLYVEAGHRWAEPDLDHAAAQMRALRDNPDARAKVARAAQDFARQGFSDETLARRYRALLVPPSPVLSPPSPTDPQLV